MAAVLPFSFSSVSSPFLPLLLSLPQAQNTQQTGFKGNLRLLVKTLEQPHLPFKILPAALSHCLHLFWSTDACCFHCLPFYPPRIPGEGGHMCWGYISLSHTYSHLKKDLRNRARGSECLSLYLYTCTTTGERCLQYVWLTCGHVAYHAGLSVTTDSATLEKSTCQSLSSPLLCSGCSAASFSLPLWNHESPSLTHTKTCCLAPSFSHSEIYTSLSSSAPSILLSPHSDYKKILCCLWFPSFLIFYLLSVCALCSVSLSVQGPNKSTSLHNHLTSIFFLHSLDVDAKSSLWCREMSPVERKLKLCGCSCSFLS